jgi:hypothetical protein
MLPRSRAFHSAKKPQYSAERAILRSPLVPYRDALFQDSEMFLVRHRETCLW